MIALLQGIIHSKDENGCILLVNGVGYRVHLSGQTIRNIPAAGEYAELLIYHHITENDQRLFGFAEPTEMQLFERLITVKGVGPKLGLTILSGMPAIALMEAIISEDTGILSSISGIGKKTAERMVLELKDKLINLGVGAGASFSAGTGSASGAHAEALSALEALGFRRREAEKALTAAAANSSVSGLSTQDLIKAALAELKR